MLYKLKALNSQEWGLPMTEEPESALDTEAALSPAVSELGWCCPPLLLTQSGQKQNLHLP